MGGTGRTRSPFCPHPNKTKIISKPLSGIKQPLFIMKLFLLTPSATKLADYPQLLQQVYQLATHYQTGCVTEDELKILGLALWHIVDEKVTLPALLPFDKRGLERECSFQTPPSQGDFSLLPCDQDGIEERFSLVIVSNEASIQALPWECLYHPSQGFLGKHPSYTLSRSVSIPFCPGMKEKPSTMLNILLYTAHTRHAPLALEAERDHLRAALQPWLTKGTVHLFAPNDGRFSTLATLIAHSTWQVVILSGHCLLNRYGQATFVFEGDNGQDAPVTGATLAEILRHRQVQCVVLAACQSGKVTTTDASLAWHLHCAGIPHVIGFWETLLDRAGSIFVRAFSVAIAQGQRIDVAVHTGRQALTQLLTPNEIWRDRHSDPSIGQWCLPLLWSDAPEQSLLTTDNTIEMPIHLNFTQNFVGRRRELRVLEAKLRTQNIRYLLIHGIAGVGKSALVQQLTITLADYGHSVLTLTRNDLSTEWVNLVTSDTDLLWLDDVELTPTVYLHLETLRSRDNLQIIVTCRHLPKMPHCFQQYHLLPLEYPDFQRYIHYLGMPHCDKHIRLMYRMLAGNFRGVQLLHSLPVCMETTQFIKQLHRVQRYLQAYWREIDTGMIKTH